MSESFRKRTIGWVTTACWLNFKSNRFVQETVDK